MNIVVHGSLTIHQSSHRVAHVWPLGPGPMCPPRVDQDTSGLYCFKQATFIPCGGPCAIRSEVFLPGSSGKCHTNGLVTWSDKCNACFKPLQFLTPVLLRSPTVRIVGLSPRVQYSDRVRHTTRPYTQYTCTLKKTSQAEGTRWHSDKDQSKRTLHRTISRTNAEGPAAPTPSNGYDWGVTI